MMYAPVGITNYGIMKSFATLNNLTIAEEPTDMFVLFSSGSQPAIVAI
jgi:hypothetical protein